MIDRRSMMKSAVTLIGAPALPAVAGGFPRLGRVPIHTEAEFRTAFDAYIDAYGAFFSVRPSELPDEHPRRQTDETRAIWQRALARCRAWRRTRKRLVRMVLEANGYEIDGPAPPTVAAAMVDLGDALLVVSHGSDYEGTEGTSWMNCINFCIAPRTSAMRARLLALPSWPSDETCDDSWYTPHQYQIPDCAGERPEWRPGEEDDDDPDVA
jgi:hypothetical protein